MPDAGPLTRVLLVGTGGASPRDLRKAGAALARKAKGSPALVVDLRGLRPSPDAVGALVEGLLLASYGFTLKPGAEPRVLQEVVLVGADAVAVLQAVTVCRATALARDLVNTPPREASPDWLARTAVAVCADLDHPCPRRAGAAARRGSAGSSASGRARAVRRASSRSPTTAAGSRHVVLVGKGITFDTGGLSLKPNASMLDMKSDMGGAAAVLGAVRAAADLQLPLRVTALLALAENMPSGTAQRPGDVLTQYGGRTVEVLNTDAEGRLVLADALVYADRDLQADVVVDVATLTGAMPVALGKKIAGLFANDDALADELAAAAEASGERLWRLPLVDDYRHALDSPTADLRNIGDPRKKLQGGSITAALFLREFVGGRPWAHLDIAGPAMAGGDDEELHEGRHRLRRPAADRVAAGRRRGAGPAGAGAPPRLIRTAGRWTSRGSTPQGRPPRAVSRPATQGARAPGHGCARSCRRPA